MKRKRLSSSTKIPRPKDGKSDGVPPRTVYTKITNEVAEAIEAEADRRGYPHTFTSVLRETIYQAFPPNKESPGFDSIENGDQAKTILIAIPRHLYSELQKRAVYPHTIASLVGIAVADAFKSQTREVKP